MRAILTVLVCLMLTACGLKDDLYLPDPASEAAEQTAQESDREADA